jgi:hypothetical protein
LCKVKKSYSQGLALSNKTILFAY